jgi:hypothetical protein
MPSPLNEALEWLDRAEQAREVAGQLTEPGARRAVLELADSFDRLARAAATRAVARRRELARYKQEGAWCSPTGHRLILAHLEQAVSASGPTR